MCSFDFLLADTPQVMRREQHPSDQDLKQKRRDPFPFQSDDEELPLLTWTLIRQGTYSKVLESAWLIISFLGLHYVGCSIN